MKVQCPAKINLFLEITGRRGDGYHRLATLFAKINIYDVLELEVDRSGKVSLSVETGEGIGALSEGPDNLVLRAAEAFRRHFRVKLGVRLRLTKRIPMGAGLGGGSSDAAGTLLGLAGLFKFEMTRARRERLKRLGTALGADVPFFLRAEPFCLAQGIGDRLRPLEFPKSLPYLVLVYPGYGVSTKEAYRALRLPARSDVLTRLSHLDKLILSLKKGKPISHWQGCLFNRLEDVDLPVMAQIDQARSILSRMGAAGVRMTGSGSAFYGFVPSHAEGERIVKRLEKYPWRVFLTSCQG